REWASKMKQVGLMPSDTGQPGGKPTGQNMSHYIVNGGRFDHLCRKLLKEQMVSWGSVAERMAHSLGAQGSASKVKFSCPLGQQNAWAKPSGSLICGKCYRYMVGDERALELKVIDAPQASGGVKSNERSDV